MSYSLSFSPDIWVSVEAELRSKGKSCEEVSEIIEWIKEVDTCDTIDAGVPIGFYLDPEGRDILDVYPLDHYARQYQKKLKWFFEQDYVADMLETDRKNNHFCFCAKCVQGVMREIFLREKKAIPGDDAAQYWFVNHWWYIVTNSNYAPDWAYDLAEKIRK